MQALVGQKKEANLYSADATVEGKIEIEIVCIYLYRMYGRMALSHTNQLNPVRGTIWTIGPKNWKYSLFLVTGNGGPNGGYFVPLLVVTITSTRPARQEEQEFLLKK